MKFSMFKQPETRKFDYKPRYYTPEDQAPTGDHRRDFANELHREWSDKRKHTAEEKKVPWLPIMIMVFFVVVLALVFFRFFVKY